VPALAARSASENSLIVHVQVHVDDHAYELVNDHDNVQPWTWTIPISSDRHWIS
jgi:hypothetical protein